MRPQIQRYIERGNFAVYYFCFGFLRFRFWEEKHWVREVEWVETDRLGGGFELRGAWEEELDWHMKLVVHFRWGDGWRRLW